MAVRAALIGCGGRGINAHGAWMRQSPQFDLVAVCDLDKARRSAASDRLQVPGLADYRDILNRRDIQAVIIATNARSHAPIALDAIQAGKHVLIEKPLADTAAAAYALTAAAERAAVIGMVGYQFRLSDFATAFKAAVTAIEPLQGLFTVQRGPMAPQYFFAEHYGGVVDTATHTIHLALWTFADQPASVYAHVGRGLLRNDQTIDRFELLIEFADGRSVTVVSSMFGVQAENTLQVIGRSGSVVTHDRKTLRIVQHPALTEPGPVRRLEGLTIQQVETAGEGDATGAMLDHFAALILGDVEQQRGTTLREGALAIAVTEAMVQAASLGRKVALESVLPPGSLHR